MKKWQPKSIKLNAKGLAKFLGERESDVMEIAWDKGCVSVRDVCDKLCERREYSFNTIMTIMNRLSEKGLLVKSQEGGIFCYKATQGKEELIRNAIKAVFSSITEDKDLKSTVDKKSVVDVVLAKDK